MKIQCMTMRPAPLLSKGCPIGMKPARTVPVSVVQCGSKRGPRITHDRHSDSTFTIACLPSGLALLNVVVGNMGSSRFPSVVSSHVPETWFLHSQGKNWWIDGIIDFGWLWQSWEGGVDGIRHAQDWCQFVPRPPLGIPAWQPLEKRIICTSQYLSATCGFTLVWTLNIVEQQHVIKRYQKKIINKNILKSSMPFKYHRHSAGKTILSSSTYTIPPTTLESTPLEPGIKHARWQGSIQLFFFGVEAKEQVHL